MTNYGVDVNMDGVLTGSESEMKSCSNDDTYTFSTAGTYQYNPGTVKCSSELSSSNPWNFYLNETKLYFQGDNFEIKTLTESKMELHIVGPASIAIRILTR